MTRASHDPAPASSEGAGLRTTLLFVLVGVSAVQLALTFGLSKRIGALEADVPGRTAGPVAAPTPAPQRNPFAGEGTLDEKVDALRADFDVMANDVIRIGRKLDDLTLQLENRGAVRGEPEQPAELDWTRPELFETARKGADSCGFALTKDELRCPARLILREGMIEYFAVLKGGKEHETLFSIVGSTAEEARRPKDMGVKMNNALQALGFRRGKPIRVGPTGTEPAQGETVHVYAEWTTGGTTEVVRAEDLVWHRVENRPMRIGTWVFVGSLFVPGDDRSTLDFAADLTAEAMATYSSPATIVDNVDTGAEDDTVFLVATPRIPRDVDHCTLVFRRSPLPDAAVKVFPPIETAGGPAPDEGASPDDGK